MPANAPQDLTAALSGPATTSPSGRRQEQSAARRRRILEAAQESLGELGYARATVSEIARRAGVSNGLLYQFFRNKEDLFGQVLGEVVRDWVREMVPREGESAPEALEGMFRRSVAFCRSHPLLPALLRDDPALQLARLKHTGSDRVQAHRDLVARLLRSGIDSGEFRGDLDVPSTADVICQLQSDYSGRAWRGDASFPDDPRVIETAIGLIRAAVDATHRGPEDR